MMCGIYIFFLNRYSLKRDADPEPNVKFWQTRFENISGFGVLFYSIMLFIVAIYWVMSLDPNWYSTVYGFQFLVGQAYGVFALALLTLMALAKAEPIKSTFRVTEQHDMGKLCFAFVMLNIYLAFGAFLIIWSGNSPEEIPWYLDRIRGNWGIVATLDFIFHWLLPFTLLLSADLKRIRKRPGRGLLHHDLRPRRRHVLAHRAELPRRRAQPALERGNLRVRHRCPSP